MAALSLQLLNYTILRNEGEDLGDLETIKEGE
jgi:hypothetical protein